MQAESLRAAQAPSASDIAAQVIDAAARSAALTAPYRHWLLEDILPDATLEAIASLPFAPPGGATFDGRRESNNSSRVYFSPQIQARFPVCAAVADAFRAPDLIAALTARSNAPVGAGRLRIEYCQDVDGFWLEPHVDIPVKLFTMLIYLSNDPALSDAGTDIYDASPEHRPAGRAAYAANHGLIFIPGVATWHGFSPRPIRGLRKSVIINYVTDDWRAREELA